jgi:hypothetical protein
MGLFTVPETLPFGVALAVMLGLAVLEGLGLFTATSPGQWLDNLVPDTDGPDGLHATMDWLHLGRVPVLVLLILFLAGFALCGYLLQLLAHGLSGHYLPGWLAALPAVLGGLSTVRGLGAVVAWIIPRDETSAVSDATLIGRAGVVTIGTARTGMAAEVKVKDHLGRGHYLMVEPDTPDEEFPQGTAVLIVKKVGATYRGIRNPHPDLLT